MRISDWSSDVCSSDLLDWSATVSARRSFLSQCPASGDSGMSERIDAISRGAGKCDAEFLNQTYDDTAYKWRKREYGGDSGQTVSERSEERRVGKEGDSTWRYRGSP